MEQDTEKYVNSSDEFSDYSDTETSEVGHNALYFSPISPYLLFLFLGLFVRRRN